MRILVTGGTGYIGSHTVIKLIERGDEVVIVDNLSNSNIEVLNRIEKITSVRPTFYKVNCQNIEEFEEVFKKEKFDSVIHFAGLKSVAESVKYPQLYIDNNIGSSKVLVELMLKYHVNNLVFSSSATVYGDPERVPIKEDDKVGGCTNPYGQTKLDIEYLLKDACKEHKQLNVALLRYFNPIGAHESGLIGEDPNGIPNNLMPYITQVAFARLPKLFVYGDKYPTSDGTGVRDYIHVIDLANGHLSALDKLNTNPGLVIYNLGTGNGVSVLELIHAFEEANDIKIPYEIVGNRPGDIATCYADASKAERELGWVAKKSIVDACKDSYRWQKANPNGYKN